jgi:hypothetical protein
MAPVPQQTTVGADFARAFAGRDTARMRELLHPDVDFRALTPNRFWEADGQDGVIEVLFGSWLEATDHVQAVEGIEGDTVADRERVGYRFTVTNPDGRFLVEQQAYLSTREGRIDWMRVVCSGFRPAA